MFTISNDGYLDITHVQAGCYIKSAVVNKGIHIEETLGNDNLPTESTLIPAERYTVPCAIAINIATAKIDQADLAIVVYFRPWPLTFLRRHRLFRFVARAGENGQLIWEPQPSAELEPSFDKFITERHWP